MFFLCEMEAETAVFPAGGTRPGFCLECHGRGCLYVRMKPNRHPQKPFRHPGPQCKPLRNKKDEAGLNIHLAAAGRLCLNRVARDIQDVYAIGTTSMPGKWRQTTGLSGSGMAHNRPLCYLSCVIILKKGVSCLCARVKPHRHPQKPCRHPDPQCKPLPNKKYEARMNIHLAAESAFA